MEPGISSRRTGCDSAGPLAYVLYMYIQNSPGTSQFRTFKPQLLQRKLPSHWTVNTGINVSLPAIRILGVHYEPSARSWVCSNLVARRCLCGRSSTHGRLPASRPAGAESSNRRHRLNYILTWSLSQTVTQELLKTPQIPSKSPNPRLLKAQLVHLWFSPRTTITRTKLSLELTPASELLKMLKYQMMEIGSCFEDEGERRAKIRGQQTQSRDSLSWQVRLTFSRR